MRDLELRWRLVATRQVVSGRLAQSYAYYNDKRRRLLMFALTYSCKPRGLDCPRSWPHYGVARNLGRALDPLDLLLLFTSDGQ